MRRLTSWIQVGAVCVFFWAACSDQVIEIQGGACPVGKRCEIHEAPGAMVCVSKSDWKYGCGNADCVPCLLPNTATYRCKGEPSVCGVQTCIANYDDCDDAVPGCETSLINDVNNCGMCGQKCTVGAAPNVMSVRCGDSRCQVANCAPRFFDCGNGLADGCETPASVDNCGKCGKCGGLTPVCDTTTWTCKAP